MVIAVTGASGQVGQALCEVARKHNDFEWHFWSRADVDISDFDAIYHKITELKPDTVVNLAAHTAVDKAETDMHTARLINVDGARNVAKACHDANATLIHLSTDFVFSGTSSKPYLETDPTGPISVYGRTKLEGELEVRRYCPAHFIVRSSWIYSDYGNNFYKTMLRLATQGGVIRVVDDQTGAPTHAIDLAEAILTIARSGSSAFGTYHFSNSGQTTWFGFARAIFDIHRLNPDVSPVTSEVFNAPAQRPRYSVLDCTKIARTFGIMPSDWKDALQKRRRP